MITQISADAYAALKAESLNEKTRDVVSICTFNVVEAGIASGKIKLIEKL